VMTFVDFANMSCLKVQKLNMPFNIVFVICQVG
jgi:hypothetical protein